MNWALIIPLLIGSLAVTWFARARGWPAPLLVTVVAMAVSFIPAMPQVDLNGELVLWVVLPPLLYSASLDASFLSFRESLRPIRRLGVGLVVATTAAVGAVTMLIVPQYGWAAALLLGAIVAPPDAVSAAAIGRKLGLPRRVMSVISGESLVNDATSLTLYRVFVAIVAGATVSWMHGLLDFGWAVVSGVGIGLLIGAIVHQIRMRASDTVLVSTMGLLVPFIAYSLGEVVHGSGVLAVVFAGLYVGFHAPLTRYTMRQQERPLWSSVDTLLEGAVFALIGLQITQVINEIDIDPDLTWRSFILAVAVLVTVIVVRPIWVFSTHLIMQGWSRVRSKMPRAKPEPNYTWQELTVISWTGMRGVVTLAAAAALPATAGTFLGTDGRQVIFAIAFMVTIGTLLIQGLTLAPLIRKLKVHDPSEAEVDAQQAQAVRRRAAEESLAYLEQVRPAWVESFGDQETDKLFARFAVLLGRVGVEEEEAAELSDAQAAAAAEHDRREQQRNQLAQLSRDLLAIRRRVVLDELRLGNLSEEKMREMFDSMDAEELAFDAAVQPSKND